jgi:Initiator Replication protein
MPVQSQQRGLEGGHGGDNSPLMAASAIPITRALTDRAAQADALIASGPVVNLRFRHGQRALSLRAGKMFHLLVKHAGAKLTDDTKHSMRLAELWALGHLPLAELVEIIRELQTTLVEIVVATPGEGGEKRVTTITGPMLDHVEQDHDDTGNLVYRFSETMRRVMALSDHWAVLSKRAVLAFESRYALRLYEILALRQGLQHKTSEVFPLDDLRLRLGVPAGTLPRWQDLKRRALEPAIAEVNQLSGLSVKCQAILLGRAVTAVKLTWREKDAHARQAVARELDASRVGRRARRAGLVELVVAAPIAAVEEGTESTSPAGAAAAGRQPLPSQPEPPPRRVVSPPSPFPASGTISYSRWGELVRQHAPAPTPDVDRVASAFRDWTSHAGLPLGGPTVEKAFVTFCRNFRSRRQ